MLGAIGEARGREPDLGMLGEALGEVGEQLRQDLALAALGTQNLSQDNPLREAVDGWIIRVKRIARCDEQGIDSAHGG